MFGILKGTLTFNVQDQLKGTLLEIKMSSSKLLRQSKLKQNYILVCYAEWKKGNRHVEIKTVDITRKGLKNATLDSLQPSVIQ